MNTQDMKSSNNPQVNASAADTLDAPVLSPAEVVTQLRVLGKQIPDITPLTTQERLAMRGMARVPPPVVRASVTVIGASEVVQQAVGQQPEHVSQWLSDAEEWSAVENELRAMLKNVVDANLVRRQRAGLAASRAYIIGRQVARDPQNADLRPHVEEVKRQKSLARRKKSAAQTPETPAPGHNATNQ